MTTWPPDPAKLMRPVYRSLASSIAGAIDSGKLQPGERLPTHRELAYQLGISVQTVSRAYEELIRTDLVVGEVGRGTYVKDPASDHRAPPFQRIDGSERVIDCSMLTPVRGALHDTALTSALREMSRETPPADWFSFRPRHAYQSHMQPALRWLKLCGLAPHPEQVLPVNGATVAMNVAVMTAATSGDLVVTEDMGHHTLKTLARIYGLRLTGLACDEQGILPDALDHAARHHGARVLYVMPSGNSPRTLSMGAKRRTDIVALARKYDLQIIENDAWGPLEPDRPPPLAALAPERVFHVSGVSKCLMPALRFGWLVVPQPHVTAAFSQHMVTDWMANPLSADIVSRWIADGTALKLLNWQRDMLARRNALVRRHLGGLGVWSNPHGMHVWLPLPGHWDETSFVSSARQHGVAVAPGHAFETGVTRSPHRGVRICLGGPNDAELAEALRLVAWLAQNRPGPEFLTF
ncbi:PLP-dependent aminotransferase family protein [Roseinatronobacter alkalisoli]|uniref:PLP-dependent aminotransferase family protein n=1 Tax=Roseinatronobacter alkalisoli TaxID=3028235 RepID=A0ABT5T796_9RHOB|nr:PLP-dependent aminotransferase family protein [Roseinatronobacter sp. HJB301]MDD7971007.1 PLP-dependent aminotransferase family protein [Roseinatronobacter sp. HJB301]